MFITLKHGFFVNLQFRRMYAKMITETTGNEHTALLGKTVEELGAVVQECGMPRFAARQIADWLYRKKIDDIEDMTNLSLIARQKLAEKWCTGRRGYIDMQHSRDHTTKCLFPAIGGGMVETVYIPEGERTTVCVSSQVGCKMHCAFCLTGKQGFTGNLDAADILNQICSVPNGGTVTNIVFMGQGEPLDNYKNVIKAIEILTSDKGGFGMSPKRITLSTCGLLPGLKRFVEDCRCNLAISLHSPYHEERAEIMPSEKAYPISDVVAFLKTCEAFRDTEGKTVREESHQRRLSFEYVLLKEFNDSPSHAANIASLLKGLDCRVNVIPFHSYKGAEFSSPTHIDAERFCAQLTRHGLRATLRRSRGEDISAACGMLAAKIRNKNASTMAVQHKQQQNGQR